tara:strand:- start:702 stop:1736 length:1035 start_codon:yes stop_codon:yes gene_type:complete
MKILVTGNLGYVGTVLSEELATRGYNFIGLDVGFYEDCLLGKIKNKNFNQIYKDIRDLEENDLEGIDCIIHLAALSNDPLGALNEKLTYDINYQATVRLAELSKKMNVKKFIYLSSLSIYGISNVDEELDEYKSIKNPITAYAKAKWMAEQEIHKLSDDKFTIVSLRPSTVFGVSNRLRSDIVFNNLVGCAFTTNNIEIKSDGTPWRPIVHIKDLCEAIIACIKAPKNIIFNQAFNVGIKNGNYTVKEIAEAAQKAVPGSKLVFTGEHGSDSRTYKISFNKIISELKDYYKPSWDLHKGGLELTDFFKKVSLKESDFRGFKTNRLECLKKKLSENLDVNLRFRS